MNIKFGFFPYEAMNYKAAQTWLDLQAEQGWELKHIYLSCVAYFQRVEKPNHFVDLDMQGTYDDPDSDYLQLCSDAGWELVQRLRGMLLFRAAPGKTPIPIQTDGELEWERFWEKYRPRLWSTLLTLLGLGVLAFLVAQPSRRNMTAMLATNYSLSYLLFLALALLCILLHWSCSRWYLARCRRSGQVESPGPLSILPDSMNRLGSLLLCLVLLLGLFEVVWGKTVDLHWYPWQEEYTATVEACREWPVVLASDLDLPDSEDSRHLEGFRSILVDFLEYSELTDGEGPNSPTYILTTERYDCVSKALAKLVISQRRKETQNGSFRWGELDWQPAPNLGFDECYTSNSGAYLLLRQGNVVALVGCSGLDLTTDQSLETVRERILSVST